MTNPIILHEYESLSPGEKIEEQEFKQLQQFILQTQRQDRPVMTVGHNKLTAKNYVGTLQTKKGTVLEILPKIDLDSKNDNEQLTRKIFLKMLRTLPDSPFKGMDEADIRISKNFPLLEAFITMFLKTLQKLVRRGLARSYHEVEENLQFLKGKLLIAQQLQYNVAHQERFFVRYDEFSTNRPVNRLLKSALLRLQSLSHNNHNRQQIYQLKSYFEDVPMSHNIDADLSRATIDRTISLYDRLLPWTKLFLKGYSPTTYHGNNLALALLFPMEKIFESYVTRQLQRQLKDCKVKAQDSKYYLLKSDSEKEKQEFQLKPDIVVRKNNRILIMDAKWKRLNNDPSAHYNISQGDLYQIYAYGKKYQQECPHVQLGLLYPKNKDTEKLLLRFKYESELPLQIRLVDLEKQAEDWVEEWEILKWIQDG